MGAYFNQPQSLTMAGDLAINQSAVRQSVISQPAMCNFRHTEMHMPMGVHPAANLSHAPPRLVANGLDGSILRNAASARSAAEIGLLVNRAVGILDAPDLHFLTTEPVVVHGTKATDIARVYEQRVVAHYADYSALGAGYRARVDGMRVTGIADHAFEHPHTKNPVAVEAKFVADWATSIRNPYSDIGSKPWAVFEQIKVLTQARKYQASDFQEVIYHTNSLEFANHYGKLFQTHGLDKVRFIIMLTQHIG